MAKFRPSTRIGNYQPDRRKISTFFHIKKEAEYVDEKTHTPSDSVQGLNTAECTLDNVSRATTIIDSFPVISSNEINLESDKVSVLSSGTITHYTLSIKEELTSLLNKRLLNLTVGDLRDICRLNKISKCSSQKREELTNNVFSLFHKMFELLNGELVSTLKQVARANNISGGISSMNKPTLIHAVLVKIITGAIGEMMFMKPISHVYQKKEIAAKPKNTLENNKLSAKLFENDSLQNIHITPVENKQKKKLDEQQQLADGKKKIEMKLAIEKQKLEMNQAAAQKELELQVALEMEELEKSLNSKNEKEQQQSAAVPKKKKQAIPKQVRTIVWNHYIGETLNQHRCFCCKKVVVRVTDFEVGHVISEHHGGTHEINNLRPICGACNRSMGTMNMVEFVQMYGLVI